MSIEDAKKNTCYTRGARKTLYKEITFPTIMEVVQAIQKEGKVIKIWLDKNMAKKANSLAHTKWMCKYHIVFTPKYRRKVIDNQYRRDLGEILSVGLQLMCYK